MGSNGVGWDVLHAEAANFSSEHIPVSLNGTVVKIGQKNVNKFRQFIIYCIKVSFFVVANCLSCFSGFWRGCVYVKGKQRVVTNAG